MCTLTQAAAVVWQENALGLLARLTPYKSDKVPIISDEALEAVLNALRDFPDASTLQTYGCVILLSHVATSSPEKKVGYCIFVRCELLVNFIVVASSNDTISKNYM